MEDGDPLPLTCPKCRETTLRQLRWVQEHTFFTCDKCGGSTIIDKDAAMKILAAHDRAAG